MLVNDGRRGEADGFFRPAGDNEPRRRAASVKGILKPAGHARGGCCGRLEPGFRVIRTVA